MAAGLEDVVVVATLSEGFSLAIGGAALFLAVTKTCFRLLEPKIDCRKKNYFHEIIILPNLILL